MPAARRVGKGRLYIGLEERIVKKLAEIAAREQEQYSGWPINFVSP
jgi:hypothetical protein